MSIESIGSAAQVNPAVLNRQQVEQEKNEQPKVPEAEQSALDSYQQREQSSQDNALKELKENRGDGVKNAEEMFKEAQGRKLQQNNYEKQQYLEKGRIIDVYA